MTELTLLHTTRAHIARFERLRDRLAPDLELSHVVRADLLARVRIEKGSKALKAEVEATLGALDAPVLCTCSSLGPLAERAGALRIDRPMMEAAAEYGGPVCLAYCLQSTALVSGDLLAVSLAAAGKPYTTIRPLLIDDAWAAFEGGNHIAYAQLIASAVRAHLAAYRDTGVVVLAQASMDVAQPFLSDVEVPILDPAEHALRAALARLGQ